MAISISVHSVTAFKAKLNTHKSGSTWVDLRFTSGGSATEHEITIFFDDPKLARRFSEGIREGDQCSG